MARKRTREAEEYPFLHCLAGVDLETQKREAGYNLQQMFLRLYCCKNITAQDFCQLNHWCVAAHVPGADFQTYALRPNLQSGKYQHFLDRVLPASGYCEQVAVPLCRKKKTVDREKTFLTASMVHESLADEIKKNPDIRAQVNQKQWPPKYYEHRLVQEAQAAGKDLPLPLALFSDGVAYQRQAAGRSKTVTVFTAENLITHKRHYITSLPVAAICHCGCQGWCSYYPIL